MNHLVKASNHYFLYSGEQIRINEAKAAQSAGVSMFTLMERAGTALFEFVEHKLAEGEKVAILCGKGNNGGDGYILARLLQNLGKSVTLFQVGDDSGSDNYESDAATAKQQWLETKGEIHPMDGFQAGHFDLIVDALLGTGLSGEVREPFASVIEYINNAKVNVLSVDIPSGLCADTGRPMGICVRASTTITFVAIKKGLLTAQARDYVGTLLLNELAIGSEFQAAVSTNKDSIQSISYQQRIGERKKSSYKTSFGKVLCVGGEQGMAGAIRLAAEACLRTGAGMVKVLTRAESVAVINNGRPEIMTAAVNMDQPETMQNAAEWADVILLGPGLGQNVWSKYLLHNILEFSEDKPLVVDADALNILANSVQSRANWVLTPHPGEAARLLQSSVSVIEADRYKAAEDVQQEFGGVCVLKGAGTLVTDGKQTSVCLAGNPGMATAGMGDVLSGVIAAILAQGVSPFEAAKIGVNLHAQAGDLAALQGECGMLASDLLSQIRKLINQ